MALTFCELLAMRYADWNSDTANAGLMGTSYGISVTLIGLGMLAAGVGVLRAGVWHGWRRWTPLAIGIATFAVVTPGMFGGFVIARLAIGSWLLLLAALGWSLYVESRRFTPALIASARHTAGPADDMTPHQAASDPHRQWRNSPYSTRQWVDRHLGQRLPGAFLPDCQAMAT